MERLGRLLVCGALVFSLCAILREAGDARAQVPAALLAAGSAQQRLAEGLAELILQVIQTVFSLLPGLLVASFTWMMYTQWERFSPRVKGGLSVVLLLLALGLMVAGGQTPVGGQAAAAEIEAATERDPAGGPAGVLQVQPRSGEEVLMTDGSFRRLADPSKTDGSPADATWREALGKGMVTAITSGREQVVIMFTRRGCPWCDRQLPVLREAIRHRAGLANAVDGTAFVASRGAANSMLTAPLRVFVIDAEEFPQLTQQFGVQGFPTNLVFGRPRVAPLMNAGYQDSQAFAEMCRQAALAEPEPEEGAAPPQPKRKRRGPLGLFR